MYKILRKDPYNPRLVDFIADTDIDVLRIVDTCDAGSTVKVMEDTVHTFCKAPSGKYILESGSSSFEYPTNDLPIIIPTGDELLAGEKVSKFSKDLKVSKSGMVTGTLLYTDFEAFSSEPDEQEGYYFVFKIPAQEGVTKMSLYKNGAVSKQDINFDPEVAFRISTPDVNFGVKLDNGMSYTFYFNDVILA